jgi:O-antigen/teichoic acid export membrane protein
MGLTFIIGILLARGLGAEEYGLYAIGMSVVSLLSVPVAFGLPTVVTREVAIGYSTRDWGRFRGVLGWANKTVAISGLCIAVAVGGGLLVWSSANEYSKALIVIGFALFLPPLLALGNLRGAALRGMHRIVVGQIPELIIRPGVFLLLLALCMAGLVSRIDAVGAMLLHVAAALVAFLIGTVILLRLLPSGVRRAAPSVNSRGWIRSAVPMALTEGMRVGQGHAAILLLGILTSAGAAGLYKVADATSVMTVMPITMLSIIAAPHFASMFAEGDLTRLRKLIAWTVLCMIGGVTLLAVPLFVFGSSLLSFLFGLEYVASLPALLILIGGNLVSACFGPNSTLLNMTGYERRVTLGFGIALAVNLATAFALIPRFGSAGAATANAAGLVVWNILLWRDARRLLKMDTSVLSVATLLSRP